MNNSILIFKENTVNYLCTVCVTDNNGGKIALTIIISSLVLLGLGNWAWKKYFTNKKEITQQK
tara:strand:+ start:367 stop:555 length:189 start_codon:yes stop_codon:yes gene_type:complete